MKPFAKHILDEIEPVLRKSYLDGIRFAARMARDMSAEIRSGELPKCDSDVALEGFATFAEQIANESN